MTLSLREEDLRRGLDLFNRAHFFDAHEVLEDVWRALPRDRPSRRRLRLHIQGLIQVAVAFHHHSTGNHAGALSVLKRAMRNLARAESSFPDLDLDRLRAELEIWRQYLDESESTPGPARNIRQHPALPKIVLRSKT
jgi:predicted metal-dependent hydrolase